MLENLKKLREETGVTQKQLAETIGVSQQSINKYENHNIEPDIETLIRLADFFQTSVDYLIGHSQLRRKIEVMHPFDLNEEEGNIITQWRRLTPTQKNCIAAVIDSYRK